MNYWGSLIDEKNQEFATSIAKLIKAQTLEHFDKLQALLEAIEREAGIYVKQALHPSREEIIEKMLHEVFREIEGPSPDVSVNSVNEDYNHQVEVAEDDANILLVDVAQDEAPSRYPIRTRRARRVARHNYIPESEDEEDHQGDHGQNRDSDSD